ncbi:hypothetical protein V5O48_009492 [Marasmius crinis-equi]|uniref:F-box domain-containing protein n=1 Tax=Marasmius crinis-equi TaxID=585013 RepID=A0ABR3FB55_9AGAR
MPTNHIGVSLSPNAGSLGFASLQAVEVRGMSFDPDPSLLEALSRAPELRSIDITGTQWQSSLTSNLLSFTWSRLTTFAMDLHIQQWCPVILPSCIHLDTLIIHSHKKFGQPPSFDGSAVRLKTVRKLVVALPDIPLRPDFHRPATLCSILELPNLEELEVTGSSDDQPKLKPINLRTDAEPLIDIVERSRCRVTSLSIRQIRMTDLTVLRILHEFPEVKRLSLHGTYLFPHLFRAMSSYSSLLPRLEFLSVSSLPIPTAVAFEAMINSKHYSSDAVPLRSIHLETSEPSDSDIELANRLASIPKLDVYLLPNEIQSRTPAHIFHWMLYYLERAVRDHNTLIDGNVIENIPLVDFIVAEAEESLHTYFSEPHSKASYNYISLVLNQHMSRLSPAVKEAFDNIYLRKRLSWMREVWLEEQWMVPGLA